jgi:hypothetical protein
MTGLDLRPLSLGEILDRTFSLYRRNFVLFMGIAGIPALLTLIFKLSQVFYMGSSRPIGFLVSTLLTLIVGGIAYLFSQGAAILAIADLYLGRETGIVQSLKRVWGNLLALFGVIVLNGMAVLAGLVALIVPGVYLACRLSVCLPVALIEDRGPGESLSRSLDLTRDYAGRAFVIFVLYFALSIAIALLLTAPLSFAAFLTVATNPALTRWLLAAEQVAETVGSVLVAPIVLIATSVYYFDLRVRKEGFDLQFMLDPTSEGMTRPSSGSIPSILP